MFGAFWIIYILEYIYNFVNIYSIYILTEKRGIHNNLDDLNNLVTFVAESSISSPPVPT